MSSEIIGQLVDKMIDALYKSTWNLGTRFDNTSNERNVLYELLS